MYGPDMIILVSTECQVQVQHVQDSQPLSDLLVLSITARSLLKILNTSSCFPSLLQPKPSMLIKFF